MTREIFKTFEYPFDPLELLLVFKERENVFFLDSSNFGDALSRYSFIGFGPNLCSQQSKNRKTGRTGTGIQKKSRR